MAVRDITIIGATGQQGGGLARAILADGNGEFGVRAVTRHPGSESARRLAKLGAGSSKPIWTTNGRCTPPSPEHAAPTS